THWVIPYAQVSAALAAYRHGDSEIAIDWCDRALMKAHENVWFRNAEALFIRAMALSQSGDDAGARGEFDRAAAIMTEAKSAMYGPWHEFAICELLQAETEQLVRPPIDMPEPDPVE
ncbi:MAG TPA: hypothetical protein PK992_17565, partial [Planctomycetaceae bacterium]|nr:hypothetical protein [Planctomycetaceae bacterium]